MPGKAFHIQAPRGLWPLTWPMGLTMLRLLLLPVFLWILVLDAGPAHVLPHPHRWVAIAIFAVMAITDKLDGYLARRLNQTTALGTILDPIADKLLIACATILLTFPWVASERDRIPAIVVACIYAKDLLVAVAAVILVALIGKITIRPRAPGRISTVFQLSLVMATIIAPDLNRLWPPLRTGLLDFLWWAIPAICIISCADYFRIGILQFHAARVGGSVSVGQHQAGDSFGQR